MLEIFAAIEKNNGQAFYVGGYVRDKILGIESKDIDIEVYGMTYEELTAILSLFGEVDLVGKSFGVLKLKYNGTDIDFSLPRTESKNGVGHTGFEVTVNPTLLKVQALSRRDFTFNALMMDREGNVIDIFAGEEHLKNGVLKHVSDSFGDDPLRVLRGMQFCGRFNLIADFKTISICRELKKEFDTLSKDRLFIEFEKWLMKSINPKAGLDFLAMSDWVSCFPELRNILGTPQDVQYHPEGDVYSHTGYVLNAMNDICRRENITGERKLVLMISALCHDLGKATTTKYNKKGKICAHGHEFAGVSITESFLNSIKCPKHIIKKVLPLVKYHMIQVENPKEKHALKLSYDLGIASIEDLYLLIEADHSGRPPLEKKAPERAIEMLRLARELGCNLKAPKPLVKGEDLINIVPQGQDLGWLLSNCYENQLKNVFPSKEHALAYCKKHPIYRKYNEKR